MASDTEVLTCEGSDIVVTWDAGRCMHSGNCLRSLPDVFNGKMNPWIQPDGAAADRVAGVVDRCPSGALQYRLQPGAEGTGK